MNIIVLLFEIIVLYHLFQNLKKYKNSKNDDCEIGGGRNSSDDDTSGLLSTLNNRNVIDNNKNIVMTIDKSINSYAENTNDMNPYLDMDSMKKLLMIYLPKFILIINIKRRNSHLAGIIKITLLKKQSYPKI